MTYRKLLQELKKLNKEQLDMDVTVHDRTEDEYYEISGFGITTETDVLDINHPIITLH